MIKILFVCMGNICRSPTAEGVCLKKLHERGLLDQCFIDSAGTHAYHVGRPPDPRSCDKAAEKGVDLSRLRARAVDNYDFEGFDYILAMDKTNVLDLQARCPRVYQSKLSLLLAHSKKTSIEEVPDPYYGAGDGFETVYQLISDALDGFLDTLVQQGIMHHDKLD